MITNNYRLGVNDSFQWTCSDGYTNIEGNKQYFVPIESYRTTSKSAWITPWIFSQLPHVWGIYDSSSISSSTQQCNRNQLIRWFPTKASSSFYARTAYNCVFFGIGSGTTAPTPQDYNLESPVFASFTVTLRQTYGTTDDTRYYVNNKLLITNTQSEAFTIAELALFTSVSMSHAGSSSYNYCYETGGHYVEKYYPTSTSRVEVYMLERTVLDTPVTLNYNDTTSIDYRIVVNNSVG